MTYAKRTDAGQKAIVDDLRKIGVQVVVTNSGKDFPDVLTGWHQWVLLEIKEATGSLSRGQMRFLADSRGFVGVVSDFDAAKMIAKWPNDYALNEKQKDLIAEWLEKNPDQQSVRLKKFMELVKL